MSDPAGHGLLFLSTLGGNSYRDVTERKGVRITDSMLGPGYNSRLGKDMFLHFFLDTIISLFSMRHDARGTIFVP